ncbi:hypothetical protein TorRG33x02_071720 [Trema orientale]|uniref:Uncharacterized protein n=1 Tax=Trema orientale TaxID=63057 RepID=A0A2P5FH82_TREOI|nr:hypothetical protein TorRG33x02_071720 [Trema orientale]
MESNWAKYLEIRPKKTKFALILRFRRAIELRRRETRMEKTKRYQICAKRMRMNLWVRRMEITGDIEDGNRRSQK